MDNKKIKKIFITRDELRDEWILSYGKPEFQGGESIVIDKETAKEMLAVQFKI